MKSVVRKRREVSRLRLCSDSAVRTVCLIASSTENHSTLSYLATYERFVQSQCHSPC